MSNRICKGLAVLLVTFPLAACGGGSADPGQLTKDGYDALGKKDHAGAVESFQAALAGLEEGSPDYMRAKMGEIKALIHLDSEQAANQFLSLGSSVEEGEYATVGSLMTSAGEFTSAIVVLDAGMKRFSESPNLKLMLDKVKAEAEKKGDAGALDALKGLGYL